jgi:hypothetical protein
MIVKGKSTAGRSLAGHLLKENNDRVEILEITGSVEQDLTGALETWRAYSLGTLCQKPLYHAQINPDRPITREELDKAVSIFEKEMNLEGQARAIVMHEKEGREHYHLVYSRIDLETMRAIPDSWNYPKHEQAAREMERELGLEKTKGVFTEREGPRPDRTPSHAMMQQGDRLNIHPSEVKADVSALYQIADSGRAFVAALEAGGYTLAQGDSRAHVILDQAGGVHSLARVASVKAGALRERLKDYPLETLPTVDEARAMRKERKTTAQGEEKGAHYTSCRRGSEEKQDAAILDRPPAMAKAREETTQRRERER